MKRSLVWRLKHLVHNCVAHPLLPLAEVLYSMRVYRASDMLFKFHDLTTPDDDPHNRVRYLS